MADAARKITVSQSSHDEDELSLPPPPPVPPRPLDYEGASALSNLPVPPPKETFSTFYQQRQKSELKRIFKHIHPDLLASLDDTVDDEIIKAAQSETTDPDAAYQCEVQSMKWIFENWTLDNIGDPHATKKLLDEEELKGGDVRGTSSMFEHTDSTQQMAAKRQTSVRGDVRTSMWLFETQPLDSLNKSKTEEGELVEAVLKEPIQPGNVRGTRHLFESRPLSELGRYNSVEDCSFLKLRSELQEQKGDAQKTVKLFEAEPFCAIKDNSGNIHEIKSICREEINSSDFNTARWLFETQPLDLINKGQDGVKIIRGISLEEGHRGGVDQKRWMFETQSFDTIKEVEGVDKFEGMPAECREEANVVNKKKLFEMQPLAALKGDSEERSLEKEEIIGGDVKTSLWLFETQPMESLGDGYEIGCLKKITLSADKQEERGKKQQLFREQEIEKGDVKGFKHLFETIPLSKIAPSDEEIIEKKNTTQMSLSVEQPVNEVLSGDVRGARWMFETKPLDAIKAENEVYVIRAVTQEDIIKGDVKSARWRFETQPLDSFTSQDEPSVRVTEDFGSSNVQLGKQIFESEQPSTKFVRMVSVTDVQHGDVRTSTWLFENQTIDSLKGEPQEQCPIKTVHREDSQKGDVKRCTWLFESQPLDKIKEPEDTSKQGVEDEIPKVDVKCTTWLFETTPLDKITANNVDDTLSYLYQMSFLHSSGIIIEANESTNVSMAKYLLESNKGVQIHKEEVVEGNIQNIMLQLLFKPTLKPQVTLLREVEKGKVDTTVVELPVYQSTTTINLETDQRIQNIVQMIIELLVKGKDLKKGIVMQETSTIGNLIATANSQRTAAAYRVDENEKGNVHLYKSCIEKGDLQYLKSLHAETSGDEVDHSLLAKEQIEIVQGDVKEAKRSLCQQKEQVERTISDVLPGDRLSLKLLTSGGNEKANKVEPKEAKKPDVKPSGLLGRLFQSRPEKAGDTTKQDVQNERSNKTCTDEDKEAITKKVQKEGNTPQIPQLEQDPEYPTKEKSHSADPNTPDSNTNISKSTVSLNLPQTSTGEPGEQDNDLTAPHPSDDHESDLQISEPVTNLGIPDSKDLPSAVHSVNQVSDDSVSQLTDKKGLNDAFNGSIFGDNFSSAPTGPSAIQTATDKYVLKPNELFDTQDEQGRNLSDGVLFDLSHESPQTSSNLFGLSDSQEIFENIPSETLFPSPVGEMDLSADAFAKTFSLLDSQPVSPKNQDMFSMTSQLIVPDSVPLNQDRSQSLDPFGTNSQTTQQDADFDIFSSDHVLFNQPPLVNVSNQGEPDSSTTQPSTFPDDIFGISLISANADLFTVLPSSPDTSTSLNDLFGSDTSSIAAPSAQINLFADDIFASESQLLSVSEQIDSGRVDSFLVSEINSTEQASGNTVKNSSMMDDLLG
uniref:Uncharacterized protein n=1 Tax=Monopterus albus TaxID=43700 RepID=A0A3Q3JS98_MONAL